MVIKEKGCKCGREHINPVDKIISGSGVVAQVADVVAEYNGTKAFVLCDKNTFKAAGETVCSLLENAGIAYTNYILSGEMIEPDEKSVGLVVMNYDISCDIIIGVGSGVVNDISKIIANVTKNPYIIVATAPSMDGYASATSSMAIDGLKVSLPSKCANVIIGDVDILKNAPLHLLKAGLGDMLAKYVSICEWRISNIITGEYYCEDLAQLVREALKKCTDNAEGLLKRDEEAVMAVFDGLALCGVAMAYAKVSRPASGTEHYFSHVWDMRGLEFGTDVDLHGVQCAIGTYYSAKLYDQIRKITPDKEKALNFAENFNLEKWNDSLRNFLGKSAEAMIQLEKKEGKYNSEEHKKRLDVILEKWDEILKVIDEELPSAEKIKNILDTIELPSDCEKIGIEKEVLPMTFKVSKDFRDKYVLSRLCWDLGIIDEMVIN